MVLQRWQTVYLLISVIAMALAAAFPAVEPLRVAQPVVELGGAVFGGTCACRRNCSVFACHNH